jgi:hypothetical protein
MSTIGTPVDAIQECSLGEKIVKQTISLTACTPFLADLTETLLCEMFLISTGLSDLTI